MLSSRRLCNSSALLPLWPAQSLYCHPHRCCYSGMPPHNQLALVCVIAIAIRSMLLSPTVHLLSHSVTMCQWEGSVSVMGEQPLPMDCGSPAAPAISSVDLHAESLRSSTGGASVTPVSCSAIGQGCGTADTRPQHPLLLGQCPPTNLMFALLKCDGPVPHTSCNISPVLSTLARDMGRDRSNGVSQSHDAGPADDVSRCQLCQHVRLLPQGSLQDH